MRRYWFDGVCEAVGPCTFAHRKPNATARKGASPKGAGRKGKMGGSEEDQSLKEKSGTVGRSCFHG